MPYMLADIHLSSLSDHLGTKCAEREILMYRDPYIKFWHRVSGRYVCEIVERICLAMLRRGIHPRDKIVILSDNMPECIYVSLAAYKAGITVVPVYAGTSLARLEAIVKLTEAHVIFAGGQEQYDIAAQLYNRPCKLSRIITFDPEVVFRRKDLTTVRFDEFTHLSCNRPVYFPLPGNNDIADIIFTSGTTGEPKGVAITHGMYAAAFRANARAIRVDEGWKVLEYLPYSHIFERSWAFFCLMCGATLAINRQPSHLQRAMVEIRPDAMCCVPHFWEKVYEVVNATIVNESPQMRKWHEHCLETGRKYNVDYRAQQLEAPAELAAEYAKCDRETFLPLRQRLGLENAKVLPTAGAVVSREIETFARSCGLPIVVGYGLTESTATVSCDVLNEICTAGSVGRTIDGLHVAFGENNEILLRGDTIANGYYRNVAATNAVFVDNWFHTGDAGCLVNGELYITGRIKQLMKTSNGKYVAPEQVEAALNSDPAILQTVVIAEGRKYVSALIVPAPETTAKFSAPSDLRRMIWERIAEKQKNLPPFCRVKRFMLLPGALTTDNGCMTPTMKIRRDVVAKKFAELIEIIYDNKKYKTYDNL